ncbi:unnamed protein product [Parajaminaea phylloscopi]
MTDVETTLRRLQTVEDEDKNNKEAGDVAAQTADVPALSAGAEAAALSDRKRLEKSLKRKLDFIMLPTIFVVYILNYLDRQAIAQARLSGLESDLQLSDTQYQNCLSMLFLFYILLQVPSNLMLAWCGRPRFYLGFFICLWGAISACAGAVQNYHQLLAVRILLGMSEAPFFPGAIFTISRYYTRTELTVRMSILYSASLMSNAFAGLVAAGILGNMEGVQGLRAWRWLFILVGSITVGVGLITMILLPDHADKKQLFYTKEELQFAEQRLAEDAGEADDTRSGTPWQGFLMSLKDPKVWVLTFMLFAAVLGSSYNMFFPTLVKTLGYAKVETLLLTAPPWVFGVIFVYLNSLHADRTGERFWHITGPMIVGLVGFILAAATKNTGARYFAMFLMTAGYGGYTTILSWSSNTIPRPTYKRAAALAMINCISNTGNLVGSYIWPIRYGPRYWQSFTITGCCFFATILFALILRIHLTRLNKELDRVQGPNDYPAKQAGDIEADDSENKLDDVQRVARARVAFRYLV